MPKMAPFWNGVSGHDREGRDQCAGSRGGGGGGGESAGSIVGADEYLPVDAEGHLEPQAAGIRRGQAESGDFVVGDQFGPPAMTIDHRREHCGEGEQGKGQERLEWGVEAPGTPRRSPAVRRVLAD